MADNESRRRRKDKEPEQRGRTKDRQETGQWGIPVVRDRSMTPDRRTKIEQRLRPLIKEHPERYDKQDTNVRGEVGEALLHSYFINQIGERHAADDYVIVDLNEIAQQTRPDKTSPGVDYLIANKKTGEFQWVQLKTLTDNALTPQHNPDKWGAGYLSYLEEANKDADKGAKWFATDPKAATLLMDRLAREKVRMPPAYENAMAWGKKDDVIVDQNNLEKAMLADLYYPVPSDYYDGALKASQSSAKVKVPPSHILKLPHSSQSIEKTVFNLFTYAQDPVGIEKQEELARQQLEQQRAQHGTVATPSASQLQQPPETVQSLTQKITKLRQDLKQAKGNPQEITRIEQEMTRLVEQREKLRSQEVNL